MDDAVGGEIDRRREVIGEVGDGDGGVGAGAGELVHERWDVGEPGLGAELIDVCRAHGVDGRVEVVVGDGLGGGRLDGHHRDLVGAEATDGLDVGLFVEGAPAEDVTTEDCSLSGGAETTCHRISVAGDPVTYETGPFCPETITDDADAGGIWFDGNGVYDLDGEFITGLAELYGDDNWQMYDEDGNVLVTETAEEFDLAARPDVDPLLQNHCVEGRVEWLENGEPISTTVLIPVEPVLANTLATTQGNLGVWASPEIVESC